MDRQSKRSNADFMKVNKAFAELSAASNTQLRRLSILITGKAGVGKSRLVNALLGKRVAEEGRRRKVGCTTEVKPYKRNILGIETVVWDSPGLQDRSCDEDVYLANLRDKLKGGFDIMIYCLKMDDQRLFAEDEKAIHALTRDFGRDIWRRAIIALTFANKVSDPDRPDGSNQQEYFRSVEKEWREAIDGVLYDLRVDSQVRKEISIVPAGNYLNLSLPTCEHWLSEFWTCCFCVLGDEAALNLYLINKERLQFPGSADMAAAFSIQTPDGRHTPEDAAEGDDRVDQLIPREIPLNKEQEERLFTRMKSALGLFGRKYCLLL